MRSSVAVENLAYDLDPDSDPTPLQTTLMYEYIPTKWITDNVCSWPTTYLTRSNSSFDNDAFSHCDVRARSPTIDSYHDRFPGLPPSISGRYVEVGQPRSRLDEHVVWVRHLILTSERQNHKLSRIGFSLSV
jgi:hypothetical protein